MTITAAADGSSLGNPGPTGWAWYIDDDRWRAGGAPRGTNNVGELTAVAELLDATAHLDEPLHVLCDSKYVIDSCTKWMRGWKYNGWKKKDGKPVLNVELMQRIDAALQGRKVTFQWVKGHAGHVENEAADERARAVAEAYSRGRAPEAHLLGPGLGGRDAGERRVAGAPTASTVSGAPAAATGARPGAAVPLWDDGAPAAPDDEAAIVVDLASGLVDPVVRTNRALLESLLHDDLEYVGADGRSATRAELIARLAAHEGPSPVHDGPVRATAVAPGAFLVRAEERLGDRRTAHASLWLRDEGAAGAARWRIRYHQVTPMA